MESLVGNSSLIATLEAELERTIKNIVAIRGRPLLADQPLLQAGIDIRNPYLDPLSLLQISLLKRRKLKPSDEEAIAVEQALATTLSGIAHGLRNTG